MTKAEIFQQSKQAADEWYRLTEPLWRARQNIERVKRSEKRSRD